MGPDFDYSISLAGCYSISSDMDLIAEAKALFVALRAVDGRGGHGLRFGP